MLMGQESAQIELMKADVDIRDNNGSCNHGTNNGVRPQESVFGDDCWIAERLRWINAQAQDSTSECGGGKGAASS